MADEISEAIRVISGYEVKDCSAGNRMQSEDMPLSVCVLPFGELLFSERAKFGFCLCRILELTVNVHCLGHIDAIGSSRETNLEFMELGTDRSVED